MNIPKGVVLDKNLKILLACGWIWLVKANKNLYP